MRFSGRGDNSIHIGDVVIVPTNQAGTVYHIENEVCVILRNGDFWYGPEYEVRLPSSKKELKQCVIDVNRWRKRLS